MGGPRRERHDRHWVARVKPVALSAARIFRAGGRASSELRLSTATGVAGRSERWYRPTVACARRGPTSSVPPERKGIAGTPGGDRYVTERAGRRVLRFRTSREYVSLSPRRAQMGSGLRLRRRSSVRLSGVPPVRGHLPTGRSGRSERMCVVPKIAPYSVKFRRESVGCSGRVAGRFRSSPPSWAARRSRSAICFVSLRPSETSESSGGHGRSGGR